MYVKVIEEGCPVCKGEVRGNDRIKYLCKKCSLIFRFKELSGKKVKEIITTKKKLDWTKK